MRKSISVKETAMQKSRDPRILMNWLLESLGIITRADHGDAYTDLLMLFAQEAGNNVPVETIMQRLAMNRSTAYKYVGRLMDAGMILKTGMNQYTLKDGEFRNIVRDMRSEANRLFEKIENRAEILDKELIFVD